MQIEQMLCVRELIDREKSANYSFAITECLQVKFDYEHEYYNNLTPYKASKRILDEDNLTNYIQTSSRSYCDFDSYY